ncbi:MAG: hypothetical protein ACOYI2_00755 [Bacillota bacterium]|jgi:DNA gyrase/topoisomerase IV subunit A|nr:hypothetical protein [Clostridia bacterium]
MSARITVIGVFTSYPQAIKSLEKIDAKRLANSEISVVKTLSDSFRVEMAQELFPLEELEGVLVSAGTIELPDLGKTAAGGPLAKILQKQPEHGITRALMHYGLSDTKANFFSKKVGEGKTLVLCETNKEKANQLANVLEEAGAQHVEKWNKSLDKPMYPNR